MNIYEYVRFFVDVWLESLTEKRSIWNLLVYFELVNVPLHHVLPGGRCRRMWTCPSSLLTRVLWPRCGCTMLRLSFHARSLICWVPITAQMHSSQKMQEAIVVEDHYLCSMPTSTNFNYFYLSFAMIFMHVIWMQPFAWTSWTLWTHQTPNWSQVDQSTWTSRWPDRNLTGYEAKKMFIPRFVPTKCLCVNLFLEATDILEMNCTKISGTSENPDETPKLSLVFTQTSTRKLEQIVDSYLQRTKAPCQACNKARPCVVAVFVLYVLYINGWPVAQPSLMEVSDIFQELGDFFSKLKIPIVNTSLCYRYFVISILVDFVKWYDLTAGQFVS